MSANVVIICGHKAEAKSEAAGWLVRAERSRGALVLDLGVGAVRCAARDVKDLRERLEKAMTSPGYIGPAPLCSPDTTLNH